MLSLKKCPSNQEHGSANPDTEEVKKSKCRITRNSPPWNHKDLGPNPNVSSYGPCERPTLQMTTLRLRKLRDLIVRPRRNQSSLTSDLGASLFCTAVLELTWILGLPLGFKGEQVNLDCTLSLWHFTLCNWKKKIATKSGEDFLPLSFSPVSSSSPRSIMVKATPLPHLWWSPHPQGSYVPVSRLCTAPHLKGCHSKHRLTDTRTHGWHRGPGPPRQVLVQPRSRPLCKPTLSRTKGPMYAHVLWNTDWNLTCLPPRNGGDVGCGARVRRNMNAAPPFSCLLHLHITQSFQPQGSSSHRLSWKTLLPASQGLHLFYPSNLRLSVRLR